MSSFDADDTTRRMAALQAQLVTASMQAHYDQAALLACELQKLKLEASQSQEKQAATPPPAAATAAPQPPTPTVGTVYSAAFLEAVQPLYTQHMGVENMGLMLYALVRFAKPRKIVEVGAGYTTLFILQALADNDAELRTIREQQALRTDAADGEGEYKNWYVEEELSKGDDGDAAACLLAIDNEEHDVFVDQSGGVAAVSNIADRLGLGGYLKVRREQRGLHRARLLTCIEPPRSYLVPGLHRRRLRDRHCGGAERQRGHRLRLARRHHDGREVAEVLRPSLAVAQPRRRPRRRALDPHQYLHPPLAQRAGLQDRARAADVRGALVGAEHQVICTRLK